MAKLNDRQQRFVEEYLIDLNATQAAIRAGYSPKTAMEQGYQLLQKTSVSLEIAKQMAEQSKRTGINADRVIRELAKMGFADIEAIEEYKMKGADKVKALELLGKHLGMFKEKVDVSIEKSEKLDDIMSQIGGEGLEE